MATASQTLDQHSSNESYSARMATKNLSIKNALDTIVTSIFAPRAKYKVQKAVADLHKILESSTGRNEIERFYFVYRVCEVCRDAPQNQTEKLLKLLFPMPLGQGAHTSISQLITFALCFPSQYSAILDSMSTYLNSTESISISIESWDQSASIAHDSPAFCSALMSNFTIPTLNVGPKILTNWLLDLSTCETEKFAEKDYPSLNHIIRYSLSVYDDSSEGKLRRSESQMMLESDIHLAILNVIQNRRCRPLSNQFLIDIATTLTKQIQDKDYDSDLVNSRIDKFAMILSVAAFSKITTISNALKSSLSKLGNNKIVEAVMQIHNKT